MGQRRDQPALKWKKGDPIKLNKQTLLRVILMAYNDEHELIEFTNDTENDPVAKYIKDLRKDELMENTRGKTPHELRRERLKLKSRENLS